MEFLPFSIPTWVFVVSGIIFVVYKYLQNKTQYWKHRGIPTNVDSIWTMLVTMHKFMNIPLHVLMVEDYKKYGRIHGSCMGLIPQLSIAEPHILRNILVKDFNMFHNRMKFKVGNPIFDKMLSVLEDEDWKRIRCIMSPTFTSSRMRKMAYLIRECAQRYSDYMKKVADENKGESIDCKKYLNNFSIDVIASAAFGTKLNSLDDPNNEFVTKARKATNNDASYLLMILFLFPSIMRLLKIDVFGGSFDFFKDFTLHVINRREKENLKVNDFLQLLLEAQKGILETSPEDANEDDDQPEFKILPKHKTMTSEEMIAQCTLFLFAGNETTSNTLAFLNYYLALNPEVQEKLIQEIDETWSNNNDMSFDVLNKMTYLDAVICEILRMEPIATNLMRECTEEYEIPELSFKVPKGMNILVPVYAMHRDEEFFPNANKFHPERFMPGNRHSIPQYAYLPFGEGPRNCIGMRFALMTLKMCVVHFFRDFRVLATEETKKPLEFYRGQGIMQPKKIMVELERRK